jgi:hypothetical protein
MAYPEGCLEGLRTAGSSDPEITSTDEAASSIQSAIIRAVKPA